MRLFWCAAALTAIVVAGCGRTSAPDDPPSTPGESAPTVPRSPGEPVPKQPPPPETVEPPEPSPPGALGSPINYDSTQTGAGDRLAIDVKGSVEGQLDEQTQGLGCARPRCGITVVINGSADDCAKSITPALQVPREGTVTIHTGPCPPPEEVPPPEENAPEEIPSDTGN
jgi:hypothetical protein